MRTLDTMKQSVHYIVSVHALRLLGLLCFWALVPTHSFRMSKTFRWVQTKLIREPQPDLGR